MTGPCLQQLVCHSEGVQLQGTTRRQSGTCAVGEILQVGTTDKGTEVQPMLAWILVVFSHRGQFPLLSFFRIHVYASTVMNRRNVNFTFFTLRQTSFIDEAFQWQKNRNRFALLEFQLQIEQTTFERITVLSFRSN